MAAGLRIADGIPIWASTAIVPSRDTVVSPTSSPSIAAVRVTSTDVFVYVRVENNGTVNLGACSCTASVPAPWIGTVNFDFFSSTTGTRTAIGAGFTFTAAPLGDSIVGPGVSLSFGLSASGRRAWGWSPDNRFFAYVGSPNGNDWFLTIVALQAYVRANGTSVAKGAVVTNENGLFGPAFTNVNFGWVGSRAVMASGPGAGGGTIARVLACPYAPFGVAFGETIPADPSTSWVYLASPCGSSVAFLPGIVFGGGSAFAFQVSTSTGLLAKFRQNNTPIDIAINGSSPSISTQAHGALGVRIGTGGAGSVMVDDPDCTGVVGGSIQVRVDRVKASTLPSANLGVIGVGNGTVGALAPGQAAWVQVPNTSGWANQSQPHWCLLAQAFTGDGTTIPGPWNGQAATPPPFPVGLVNCAQRNIDILP